MRIPGLLVIFVAATFAPQAQATPAWINPAGHGEVTITSATLSGTIDYDDDLAATRASSVLRVSSVTAAADVGLVPHLQAHVVVPAIVASTSGVDAHTTAGLGDAVVGLQVGLWDDGIVALAIAGDLKLPMYAGAPSVIGRQPIAGTRLPSSRPALGDGQVDVDFRAMFAARFPFGGFVSWENGYRLRTDDVSDAVTGLGRFAVPILDDHFLVAWNLLFINSLDPAVDDDGTAIEAVGRGFVATGPSVDVALPFRAGFQGLWLRVGAELVFRGRNAPGGANLLWGVRCAF